MSTSGIRLAPLGDTLTLPAEFALLRTLARTIWQQAYAELIPPGQIDFMLNERMSDARLLETVADPTCYYPLAWRNDDLLGYATIRMAQMHPGAGATDAHLVPKGATEVNDNGHEHLAFLHQIYVDPSAWGHGVANLLLAGVLAWAQQRHCKQVQLRVNRGNQRALAFYYKHGFEKSGTERTNIGAGYVMDDYWLSRSV